jgi:ferric iron reductase protein FhuF
MPIARANWLLLMPTSLISFANRSAMTELSDISKSFSDTKVGNKTTWQHQKAKNVFFSRLYYCSIVSTASKTVLVLAWVSR